MITENEQSNSGMIPPGHYVGRAVYRKPEDAIFGESSNHNPQVGLSFEIVEGKFKGRRYPWYGSFAEGEATRITLDSLAAAGAKLETDDITDLSGLGEQDCMLVMEHKTQQKYEGGTLVDIIDERTGEPKIIPQIQYVNPIGGARMKTAYDADGKAAFRDMMRGTLAKRGAKSSTGLPTDANNKPLF